MPKLTANHYGKSDVRLTKVVRDGEKHTVFEFSVDISLVGDFAQSYTAGDNKKIVATDSMKNTVYVIAKENKFNSAEDYAVLLAEHFITTYSQVTTATVDVREAKWKRMRVGGEPHDHSFICGSGEKHTAKAVATQGARTTVQGGVSDMLIMKTTQSAFKDFVTDRYRTLKDADDRIFATSVTATWDYSRPADYAAATDKIRGVMLDVFAKNMSFAVQQTMFEMGEAALAAVPEIAKVDLRLPNKHRIPFNLQPFGLTNENDIFVWTDEPFGDISATIER